MQPYEVIDCLIETTNSFNNNGIGEFSATNLSAKEDNKKTEWIQIDETNENCEKNIVYHNFLLNTKDLEDEKKTWYWSFENLSEHRSGNDDAVRFRYVK